MIKAFGFLFFYFVFGCLFAFGQNDSISLECKLTHRLLLPYPTFYQIDSVANKKLIEEISAKRTSRDSEIKELQLVYRALKKERKETWPCIELNDGDSYKIVYLPVDEYHKVIVKSSDELDSLNQKVKLSLKVKEIYPNYFILLELISVTFVEEKSTVAGQKFAKMEYSW